MYRQRRFLSAAYSSGKDTEADEQEYLRSSSAIMQAFAWKGKHKADGTRKTSADNFPEIGSEARARETRGHWAERENRLLARTLQAV